jgi:hypothetical protein
MAMQVSELVIPRSKVVQAIMKIWHEWETAARGDSLVETNGSVGYLLADMAVGLGLSESELRLALGEVADELAEVIGR